MILICWVGYLVFGVVGYASIPLVVHGFQKILRTLASSIIYSLVISLHQQNN